MTAAEQRPWIAGIVDTLVGAKILMRTSIPHRNRLAVILIDSAFETACRAYLQHVAKVKPDEAHRHRENIVKAVRGLLKEIDGDVWENINFYYTDIRNDFYHQTASKTITDVALLDYLDAVEFVVDTAFGIGISQLVSDTLEIVERSLSSETTETRIAVVLPKLRMLSKDTDKVVVGVAAIKPRSADDLNDYFKREGEKLRLKPDSFTNTLARNSGSKKLFYFSREEKTWKLSALGEFRLSELQEGRQK
ncbi:MAG: hypothetical protein HY038_03020 [Nitrospirae bacterium]|nr:hypothetical protein [Nitrospirota bacterium]